MKLPIRIQRNNARELAACGDRLLGLVAWYERHIAEAEHGVLLQKDVERFNQSLGQLADRLQPTERI